MKYSRIFRTLSLAAVLALLMVAIPATPALAVENIDLDDDTEKIGEYFYVEGNNSFDESTATTDVWVDIYFSREEADRNDDIDGEVENYERLKSGLWVDTDGDFKARVKVPTKLTDGDEDEDVVGGTYYVYVTYEDNDRIEAVAEFTVIAPEISLDPDEGTVGSEVDIDGKDFNEDEDIEVFYDDEEVDIEDGDKDTDGDGEFKNTTIIIPPSTAGEHTIKVEDAEGGVAETTFEVEPAMTISPESGPAGTRITITGTGFGDRVDVDIRFDGDKPATGDTDSNGSFTITFDAPAKGEGTYDVTAEDDDDNDVTVEFTLALTTSFGPTSGNIGTELSASGTGFSPNGTVTIKYDDNAVATAPTDNKGAFSVTFKAPTSKGGPHIIIVSDGSITKQFTFTMESEAPPPPPPLLPYDATKVEQPITFDWDDVTDPSGVTYTLQIARDFTFNTASIVLEKKGLTSSEYTLSAAEELETVKEEEPYHWRVKATDDASNESEWTTPGTFFTKGGGGFDMPDWTIFLAYGLGGLLLLAIGYLLGRRTAFYY